MHVDLAFPFSRGVGQRLPLDHGYTIFSALSRCTPSLHRDPRWSWGLITAGEKVQGGFILTRESRVFLRLPEEHLPQSLPLIDFKFRAFDQDFALGAPTILPLRPASNLFSPLVILPGEDLTDVEFREKMRASLEPIVGRVFDVRVGRSRRMHVKGTIQKGFGVWVGQLGPDASFALQTEGVGGRRHMGCGHFRPSEEVF